MPKFRKKPVEIDAWQYTDHDTHPDWIGEAMEQGNVWFSGGEDAYYTIRTIEGDMRLTIGNWMIKGVAGELYPCKDDIFKATYEAV
jgi:hypothetical protein